eukprot:g1783.t1
MRCVIGANGHFHRAPSTAPSAARRPSNVTGKIGQRPSTKRLRSKGKSRQNENTRSDRTNRLIQSHIDQFKKLSFGENTGVGYQSTGSKMDGESVSASDSYRKKRSFSGTSRAPFANRDSNVFDYDEKMITTKREKHKKSLQNKVKRDPLGGSKSWSGEVPNVILKDLFSAKRMKIRDLIEGKVAVIDFWLSQVGKNPFTSMDA